MQIQEVLLHPATWGVASCLGGALLSLLASHFLFTRDVGKQVAYVQGQMILILQELQAMRLVRDRQAVAERELAGTQKDLNHAFGMIRELKAKEISHEPRRPNQ